MQAFVHGKTSECSVSLYSSVSRPLTSVSCVWGEKISEGKDIISNLNKNDIPEQQYTLLLDALHIEVYGMRYILK